MAERAIREVIQLDDAFEYIAQYIEGSLAELKARNPDVETRFKRVDATRFEAATYIHGQERSQCGIWLGGSSSILSGILFSHSGLGNGNSYNESLSIEDNGFSLFLKPLGMARMGGDRDKALTPEGPQSTIGDCLLSDYNKHHQCAASATMDGHQ